MAVSATKIGRLSRPKLVEGLRGIRMVEVSMGNKHTLALAADGTFYAFGTGLALARGWASAEKVRGMTSARKVKGMIRMRSMAQYAAPTQDTCRPHLHGATMNTLGWQSDIIANVVVPHLWPYPKPPAYL
jgi:hypothetical protein